MTTNNALLSQETYISNDTEHVADIFNFLEAHEAAGRATIQPGYFLTGTGIGDQVEIPEEVHQVLRQVVAAMQQGLAVTVSPRSRTLTTQQVADLLGMSRPTLIKLLDAGEIPFDRNGTHRRILLRDALDYIERRRAAQYAALDATAVDLDDESDLEETLAELKQARRTVAARRAARNAS
jgi:excisionase family DNA binding protein